MIFTHRRTWSPASPGIPSKTKGLRYENKVYAQFILVLDSIFEDLILRMEGKDQKLMTEAMFWAGRRERCPAELREYLQDKGAGREAIADITQVLIREGYIDPARYAGAFVRDKFRFNRWGRIRLSLELRQREIPADTITGALGSIPEEEYLQVLEELLLQRRKALKDKDTPSLLHKMATFAIRRGFEPALVWERARSILS